MHTRTRNSLVVGVLAVVLAGGLVATAHEHAARTRSAAGARSTPCRRGRAARRVGRPRGAARGAGAFGDVLQRGREIQGVGKVKDICGFDPIEQIDAAALAIPAAGTRQGDFGLVAVGTFDDEPIPRDARRRSSRRAAAAR